MNDHFVQFRNCLGQSNLGWHTEADARKVAADKLRQVRRLGAIPVKVERYHWSWGHIVGYTHLTINYVG